jgi:integrase
MAAVTWERIEDGVYKRAGADGRPIYRAVRQAGKREDGTYAQEVRTFNGGKVPNALREARNWRAEGTVLQATGPRTVNAAANMTLQQALDALHQAESYAPWTLQLHGYLWDALTKADPRLPNVKLKDLGTTQLRSALAKVPATSMRDKARKLVGTIFNHFEVAPNPATKPPARRTRASRMAAVEEKQRYLEDGAVERLITAMPEQYRSLVRLLWRTGLRPGEALALRVGDYDPTTRMLTVARGVNRGVVGPTKTGRARRPILPASVAKDLDDHIQHFSTWTDPDALIFTTETGAMIELHNFRQRTWAKAAREAGIPEATPYDLRHTFCSNAVSAGVDLASVAELAGHGVDVLARTYVHYSQQRGREAAEKLEALTKAGQTEALHQQEAQAYAAMAEER